MSFYLNLSFGALLMLIGLYVATFTPAAGATGLALLFFVVSFVFLFMSSITKKGV
jgi:hypothetical protein